MNWNAFLHGTCFCFLFFLYFWFLFTLGKIPQMNQQIKSMQKDIEVLQYHIDHMNNDTLIIIHQNFDQLRK